MRQSVTHSLFTLVCCVMLCYVMLCCVVFRFVLLCFAVLYCATLRCVALRGVALWCAVLCCVTCDVMCCVALRCVVVCVVLLFLSVMDERTNKWRSNRGRVTEWQRNELMNEWNLFNHSTTFSGARFSSTYIDISQILLIFLRFYTALKFYIPILKTSHLAVVFIYFYFFSCSFHFLNLRFGRSRPVRENH